MLVDFSNCNGSSEVTLDNGSNDVVSEYGSNLKILPPNDQIRELQTIIRDR